MTPQATTAGSNSINSDNSINTLLTALARDQNKKFAKFRLAFVAVMKAKK
jgi:hypothetical protein